MGKSPYATYSVTVAIGNGINMQTLKFETLNSSFAYFWLLSTIIIMMKTNGNLEKENRSKYS